MDGRDAALVFCDAFVERDWERMSSVLGDDLVFGVGGTSPYAGEHRGIAGVVSLLRRMVDDSGGTFRFAMDDGHDVLVSDAHVAVLAPFAAERPGRALEHSYQIWQFHNAPRLGGYGGLYVADQAGFDAFWS
jgi:hypothetical protein